MAKAKETKPEKKPESPEEKKKTTSGFIFMMPAFIAGFIGMIQNKPFWANLVIIALLIYQFILIELLLKDFYKQQNY